MKKTYMLMFVLSWFWVVPKARGQSIGPSTINASGGSGTIGSNKFDWSVGEMTMVSTFSGSSVIVTQGVLQNNNGTSGVKQISLGDHLQVFPNPANTFVNLQYTGATQGALGYKLLDMTGRIIISHDIATTQGITTAQINISNLAAAIYMLEVSFTSDNTPAASTSFKIEKLK